MKKAKKVFLKILAAILAIIFAVCAVCGIYYAASRSCTLTVKVDTKSPLRDFYGWGTSDCWWADNIDDEETRNQIADVLFTDKGLNLDTYRYCLYGGYDPDNTVVTSQCRLGESFYYYNEQSGSYEYDWSKSENARLMLQAALDRGVDTVVLFANSPHYSMCINGRSSGADDGESSNISPEKYQDYVDYFLTITQHFIDEGVPVKFISPINEPQWGWGGESPAQEGCHYEKEQAVELLKLFAKGIKERNMDVKLCALESGNIGDTAKGYYEAMAADEDISSVLGVHSFHSYFNDTNALKKSKFGKWIDKNVSVRSDMSEWCELPSAHDASDPATACIMARVISNDISKLNVNAWCNWVAVNEIGVGDDGKDYSDGLLVADPNNTADYYTAYRLYGYMQFSKFVPAGSQVLDCGDGMLTLTSSKTDEGTTYRELVNETAFKTPDGKIVVVVVNEGNSRNVKFSLDDYSNVSVYTTNSELKCSNTYSGALKDKYEITANSINTFVFE